MPSRITKTNQPWNVMRVGRRGGRGDGFVVVIKLVVQYSVTEDGVLGIWLSRRP